MLQDKGRGNSVNVSLVSLFFSGNPGLQNCFTGHGTGKTLVHGCHINIGKNFV